MILCFASWYELLITIIAVIVIVIPLGASGYFLWSILSGRYRYHHGEESEAERHGHSSPFGLPATTDSFEPGVQPAAFEGDEGWQGYDASLAAGARRRECIRLNHLAAAYREEGKFDQAIRYHQQAVQLAREIHDRRGQASNWAGIGLALKARGDSLQQAIAFYVRALALDREEDPRLESIHWWNLGLLFESVNPQTAAMLMQIRVDYEREVGHPDAEKRAARVAEIRRLADGELAGDLEAMESPDNARSRVGYLLTRLAELRKELLGVAREGTANQRPRGLILTDENGQITMADPWARQLLPWPEADLVGMPLTDISPDPRWAQTVNALLMQKEDQTFYDELEITLTGNENSVEVELRALRGGAGEVAGLAVILYEFQPESERVVSQAAALRLSITFMRGYTEMLLNEASGALTEMQQQLLVRIQAEVKQISQQLKDLLPTATLDGPLSAYSLQPVDLLEILEEAVNASTPQFRERRLVLNRDLPQELGHVLADRDALLRMMGLLLTNAVKYARPDSQVVVRAKEVWYSEGRDCVRISVTHAGSGIGSEEDLQSSLPTGAAPQLPAEGLDEAGMLVEAHGGRIHVEQADNERYTVSFDLPLLP